MDDMDDVNPSHVHPPLRPIYRATAWNAHHWSRAMHAWARQELDQPEAHPAAVAFAALNIVAGAERVLAEALEEPC